MKESKYKILWDYGAYEGMKFDDDVFDTVDAAVKAVSSRQYLTTWFIVKVVEWEAKELSS